MIDELFSAGSITAGVQTAAFNLPNDAAFTAAYGTKRVMLRNIQRAKFDTILVPIADTVWTA